MPHKTAEEILAYNRQYYQRHREYLLQRQAEKNRRSAARLRQWLVELKSGLECVRCGESHPATLTFHHREASSKAFAIGDALSLKVGLKKLQAEIDKCDVLCANCHAKEHWSHIFK